MHHFDAEAGAVPYFTKKETPYKYSKNARALPPEMKSYVYL
jgi:hypothetical protein